MKYDFESYETVLTENGFELPEAFTEAVGKDEIFFLKIKDRIAVAEEESFQKIISLFKENKSKKEIITAERFLFSATIKGYAKDTAETLHKYRYKTGTKFKVESGREALYLIEFKEQEI